MDNGGSRGSLVVRVALCVLLLLSLTAMPLRAQVSIHPSSVEPAAWERFAIRVTGAGDSAVVTVRVDVPSAITILGIEPPPGWTFASAEATDSAPASVTWRGGPLRGLEFREFAILGRVAGDARHEDLVFPVQITFSGGGTVHYSGPASSSRAAPRVAIVGTAALSAQGAMAMAGIAIALALVALGVALKTVGQVRQR